MTPPAIMLLPALRRLSDSLSQTFHEIPGPRREDLARVSAYVERQLSTTSACQLTAICTHNSRRSHFTQLWLAIAADFYGLRGLETYSGGTEATAFHPHAIQAIQRAGLQVDAPRSAVCNPVYGLRWREDMPPYPAFSKTYDGAPNPQRDFAAIMVCSSAAADCPYVPGADERFAIPYEDPKAHDGTPREESAYDACFREIGRDMLYVMATAVSIR